METNTLSSPMEFKVNELLLKEVKIDYSPRFTKLVDDTVSAIKKSINSIPDNLTVNGDEAPGFVRDIGADKVEFKFVKPRKIEIGGSYALKCIAKPDINVDLFVGLPKECFHEKDYLNYRYHAKRCLYLCVIKKYLKMSRLIDKVEWSFFQNEARKPVLLVYPATKLAEVPGFFVRIIPTVNSLFNVSKLYLKRNNVRAVSQEGGSPLPTPKYNSSILEDMYLEENTEFLKKTFLGWKELGEALILLKVWARQRSSIYVHDCLNGFLLATILAYLATYAKINNSMKPLEIFRVTLNFIAKSKLWSKGLFFKNQQDVKVSEEERALCKDMFPVVLCDSHSYVNLTFRMTSNAFFELQDEATLTLKCLEKSGDVAFDNVFQTKIDFPAKYDYFVRLNLRGNTDVQSLGFCLDDECWRLYEQKVRSILNQALSDRAKFIRIIWRNISSDCKIENGLHELDRQPLLVGISVNSMEKSFRVVDIGPDADNKEEALKFRKFWGEKAELRRFQDGKIAESTVWETEAWKRHLLVKSIIDFVLLRHLSLSQTNVLQIVDQLDFALLHGVVDPLTFSKNMVDAFEKLSEKLRSLDDIPLKVSSVQPLDPAFRFTSVFPPEPHPLASKRGKVPRLSKFIPSCTEPLEVMIQLEGSGRWPMDDVAIEKTKAAFLLKIGESVEHSSGMICNATEDDVDILFCGYAFRLKILHERGLSMVNKESGNHQLKQVFSADKKLFLRGQHSSMINGLQGVFPQYGPVVRLAKRWVASHMFSACLVEEAIELLIAFIFLKPLPFTVPCSRITGFLRFLRLLAEYDWIFSSLTVDINNDLTPNDIKEINDNFMSSRKNYEENPRNLCPAMFLATSYDKASEAWTANSPNSLELKRLVAYARSSADLLTKLISVDQNDSYRWECLFRTPLNNYDAVVLLHGDRLPYPRRLLFPSTLEQGRLVAKGNATKAFQPLLSSENLKGKLEELRHKLMVNFDPLRCYVTDLEKGFNSTVKLWYDSLGGDAIGMTWHKSSSKKREREEDGEEEMDPIDILKAVGEAGKGFVRSVHFLKPPGLA